MRALILPSPSNPDSLKLIDTTLPKPEKGEVRVKLTSIGLNRGDLLFTQNRYFIKPVEDSRLGFEGAGIVDAVGINTETKLKPGDRVALCPMSFDVGTQGCLADYGIYPHEALIRSPDTLDDSETGAIWMAYFTAWGGLVEAGQLSHSESVVITAASSSVGIAAIQVANMLGAKSIACTTSEDKAQALYDLGAQHVVVQERNNKPIEQAIQHYVNQIQSFTHKQGSDLVFDAVAGPMTHALVKASKREGRIVIHGLLDRRPMDIHAGVLMKRLLTLKGYTVDQTLNQALQKQNAIRAIQNGFSNKQLKPVIAKKFALENFKQAFEYLKSNQHLGKIVITP